MITNKAKAERSHMMRKLKKTIKNFYSYSDYYSTYSNRNIYTRQFGKLTTWLDNSSMTRLLFKDTDFGEATAKMIEYKSTRSKKAHHSMILVQQPNDDGGCDAVLYVDDEKDALYLRMKI